MSPWATDEIADVAERIEARLLAARLRVELADGPPRRRRARLQRTVAGLSRPHRVARLAPELDLAVAAGTGRALWDEPSESWVEVPEHLVGSRYVALAVAGESMVPVMHPGDVVLVELGGEVTRDTVVVARLTDDEYVVKRVARAGSGEIELASLNPSFAPVTLPRGNAAVVGRVVMRWCDHDRATRRAQGEMRLDR
jgi:phage repressor protein C with HTH and peptisase S24 domain